MFNASVTGLIPLYAIGVFLSFTLSQAGMARRWFKIGRLAPEQTVRERGSVLRADPRWNVKMIANSFGAVCTAIVMLVFCVTKFKDGAWLVLILIPVLVIVFMRISHHYRDLARRLSLDRYAEEPAPRRHRVILPVSSVHRGTLNALRYARMLSNDITAVHVSVDPETVEKLKQKWDIWGGGVRLQIIDSPFRLLIEPMMDYIASVAALRQPNETITVVVPQFIPRHWWQNLLHTQTAWFLRLAFLSQPGIVITDVPYQLDQDDIKS